MVLLELKNVSKNFGGLQALNNVSFHVNQGEVFGLIGPNGSGKTTLFNCINQFFPVSNGQIEFMGKSILKLKPYHICRLGIARTFQIVKPLSRMTVLDNIIASTFCHTRKMDQARHEAEEILKFCGLSVYKDQLSKGLPIGGRKRLEIARALATKPKLLLLDETAAGLNPSELEEAIQLIQKIKENGVTILVVEHIMRFILTISDRIHAICFGQTIAQCTPDEVINDQNVINAYLGEQYAGS